MLAKRFNEFQAIEREVYVISSAGKCGLMLSVNYQKSKESLKAKSPQPWLRFSNPPLINLLKAFHHYIGRVEIMQSRWCQPIIDSDSPNKVHIKRLSRREWKIENTGKAQRWQDTLYRFWYASNWRMSLERHCEQYSRSTRELSMVYEDPIFQRIHLIAFKYQITKRTFQKRMLNWKFAFYVLLLSRWTVWESVSCFNVAWN